MGLRYRLSSAEKEKHGAFLKIKIQAFTQYSKKIVSPEKEFNFFICLIGYNFYYNSNSLECIKNWYFYDIEKEKSLSCLRTNNNKLYYVNTIQNIFNNKCDSNKIFQMQLEIEGINDCTNRCDFKKYRYIANTNMLFCFNIVPNNYYTFLNHYESNRQKSNAYSNVITIDNYYNSGGYCILLSV